MNLSISNPSINNNVKRLKTQYIAAACGLAIAAASVVGAGGLNSNNSPVTYRGHASNAAITVPAINPTEQQILIYGSQAEADYARWAFASDDAARATSTQYSVFVATSDAEESDLLASWQEAGSNVTIRSLRTPLAAVASQQSLAVESLEDYAVREGAQIDLTRSQAVQQQFGTAVDAEEVARSMTLQEQVLVALTQPMSVSEMGPEFGIEGSVIASSLTSERIAKIMSRPSLPSLHHIYVASDQESAGRMRSVIASDFGEQGLGAEVVIVNSDYSRWALDQAVNDMTDHGVSVQVVELPAR